LKMQPTITEKITQRGGAGTATRRTASEQRTLHGT
jgi:hypothetical protein